MNPIAKDWLQNLGCLLPLGFFGFCVGLIVHWVSSETGPARALITWQAHVWNGQYSSRFTIVLFLLPLCLVTWLVFIGCRHVLTGLGAYDKPSANVGFKQPKSHL